MSDARPSLMIIFGEALERADPAGRAAYLDRACGADAALRERVEALLAAHAGAGGFLEPEPANTPEPATHALPGETHTYTGRDPETASFAPDGAATGAITPDDPDRTGPQLPVPDRRHGRLAGGDRIGTVIAGRYTLVEVIGEGGMGSVYLASQSEPVKRQVALKLIKSGMDSKGVLARFDAERQALALMDHPNIARIYDGGVTPAGQPFFVMELVKGVPLTEYCDAHRLTVDARLQLFVAVCQAVQHAHQKGIIHRDLKPGNVLVTEVDGRPTPKVIDFGVAKATEQKLTDQSFSDTGAIVGTPAYMSPEQADPSSMDIDTRTDVYALGVMLYELLVGSPPIDSKQFKRGAILEMLRMVREVEPPRPSTRLSAANARPNIAANRSIDPAKLSKLLQGELDWVVMKALEKDRTRRYDTANGFARDIQRYLADEVVEARPPSRGYRLQKFVKRNKARVVAASLVFLALLGGIVGTTLSLIEARKQRATAEENLTQSEENYRLAERNRIKSEENHQLAERNFKNAEENYQLARGSVDRYLTQVGDNRLLNEPYMDGLRHELLESAREFYQAFADRRRDDPTAAKDLAIAHAKLAEIAWRMGRHDAALEDLKASRTAMLAVGPTANTDVVYVQSGLRLCSYQLRLGRYDDAMNTANQTLSDAEGGLKARPDDPQVQSMLARVLEERGAIFRQKNQKAEAIADFKRGADILERLERQYETSRWTRQVLGLGRA